MCELRQLAKGNFYSILNSVSVLEDNCAKYFLHWQVFGLAITIKNENIQELKLCRVFRAMVLITLNSYYFMGQKHLLNLEYKTV